MKAYEDTLEDRRDRRHAHRRDDVRARRRRQLRGDAALRPGRRGRQHSHHSFWLGVGISGTKKDPPRLDDPDIQVKAQFTAQVPLGRMASPDEVAHWIFAMADPGVTWMTGEILRIDGGMSLT